MVTGENVGLGVPLSAKATELECIISFYWKKEALLLNFWGMGCTEKSYNDETYLIPLYAVIIWSYPGES